jgi:hypothetical protein
MGLILGTSLIQDEVTITKDVTSGRMMLKAIRRTSFTQDGVNMADPIEEVLDPRVGTMTLIEFLMNYFPQVAGLALMPIEQAEEVKQP